MNTQLKKSLGMLREKLEFNRNRAEDNLQKALSEGNQKVEQLKGTISDLRASLEKKDTEKEVELDKTLPLQPGNSSTKENSLLCKRTF